MKQQTIKRYFYEWDSQTKTRVTVITALFFNNNIQIRETGCLLYVYTHYTYSFCILIKLSDSNFRVIQMTSNIILKRFVVVDECTDFDDSVFNRSTFWVISNNALWLKMYLTTLYYLSVKSVLFLCQQTQLLLYTFISKALFFTAARPLVELFATKT